MLFFLIFVLLPLALCVAVLVYICCLPLRSRQYHFRRGQLQDGSPATIVTDGEHQTLYVAFDEHELGRPVYNTGNQYWQAGRVDNIPEALPYNPPVSGGTGGGRSDDEKQEAYYGNPICYEPNNNNSRGTGR